MTECPVLKQTHITAQKHAEHQDATDIYNKTLVFVFIYYFYLFKIS